MRNSCLLDERLERYLFVDNSEEEYSPSELCRGEWACSSKLNTCHKVTFSSTTSLFCVLFILIEDNIHWKPVKMPISNRLKQTPVFCFNSCRKPVFQWCYEGLLFGVLPLGICRCSWFLTPCEDDDKAMAEDELQRLTDNQSSFSPSFISCFAHSDGQKKMSVMNYGEFRASWKQGSCQLNITLI